MKKETKELVQKKIEWCEVWTKKFDRGNNIKTYLQWHKPLTVFHQLAGDVLISN
jgi:hypothetical protein